MQKRQFFFYYFFMLLLLPGFFNKANSQNNCNCNKADLQEYYRLVRDDDSAGIHQTIARLKQSKDDGCMVLAYNMETEFLAHHRKLDSMYALLQKQEKLIASIPCRKELEINTYLNYATYFKAKEDYENLSRYAFKALENAEGNNDQKHIPEAIKFIVYLFTRQDQDEKNWPYIKKAEKIIMSLAEGPATARDYNWLAFEYENKYTLTERKTLLDSALIFATLAKKAAATFNDHEQSTQSFRVFEAVSYHRNDLKHAVVYMDSALFYAKKIRVPSNLSALYLSKAWDLVDLKEYTEAIRWQDTSIFYAEKYQHGTAATMKVYSEAIQIYEAAGNLPKALAAFKKYEHIKDSIFSLQRAEKINELEQRYEKSKNEKTIRELALQKRLYLLLALACLLGIAALAFFIRQQSLKNKQKILEAEQRLNRARMNPHFFFNALSALQSFALQENDGKALATNLSKFSHIMRETLESTYKEYVTIEQEAGFLLEYLELQKIRFPQKFSYEINIADHIGADEYVIPSMILQPFVENSIEHGFSGIDHAGHLTIQFTTQENDLLIIITDNGKGLATGPKENNEHISRASQIIKDRIYLLNIKLKTRASFSINNIETGKGVIVKVHLPVLYKKNIFNGSLK